MVDGLNATDKQFIFQLMTTLQLTGSKDYDTHMEMHSAIHKSNFGLTQEFQKYLLNT